MMKISYYFLLVCSVLFFISCKQNFKVQEQQDKSVLIGGERDEHGCLSSAGYIWSEVCQDCIRLFEKGINLKSIDGKSSAYIVLAPDSLRAELFFSDKDKPEILDGRSLPNGGFAWNVEDDDTYNVRFQNGSWTISRRGIELYK